MRSACDRQGTVFDGYRLGKTDQKCKIKHDALKKLMRSDVFCDYNIKFSLSRDEKASAYAGTAVLYKKDVEIPMFRYWLEDDDDDDEKDEGEKVSKSKSSPHRHDLHGRIIVCEFKEFILLNTYAPNNQTKEQGWIRRREWDAKMSRYVTKQHDAMMACVNTSPSSSSSSPSSSSSSSSSSSPSSSSSSSSYKTGHNNRQLSVWESVTNYFGFNHIARVEIVTSHPGCRDQGWHTDGSHGLTVIFPLVDVDLRKGPTQMDFTIPFNSLHIGTGKVGGKKKMKDAPDKARAAMPKGSVVLFNANMSHRGTANLSRAGRPILVLDCSPQCPQENISLWDVDHPQVEPVVKNSLTEVV